MYAGIRVQIRASPTWGPDFQIHKVKAHAALGDLTPQSREWLLAVGNDFADRHAKLGAALLSQPSEQERRVYAENVAVLKRYLGYVARALLLYPRLAPSKKDRASFNKSLREEGFQTGARAAKDALPHLPPSSRPPPPPGPVPAKAAPLAPPDPPGQAAREAGPQHEWRWRRQGFWTCLHCQRRSTRSRVDPSLRDYPIPMPPIPLPPPTDGCAGASPILRSLLHNQRGHNLFVTEHPTGILIICKSCGNYSEGARAVHILDRCSPAKESPRAVANWNRAFKGQSPNYRRGSGIILGDLLPVSTLLQLREELATQGSQAPDSTSASSSVPHGAAAPRGG